MGFFIVWFNVSLTALVMYRPKARFPFKRNCVSCGFRLRNARNASDCVWMETGLNTCTYSQCDVLDGRDTWSIAILDSKRRAFMNSCRRGKVSRLGREKCEKGQTAASVGVIITDVIDSCDDLTIPCGWQAWYCSKWRCFIDVWLL